MAQRLRVTVLALIAAWALAACVPVSEPGGTGGETGTPRPGSTRTTGIVTAPGTPAAVGIAGATVPAGSTGTSAVGTAVGLPVVAASPSVTREPSYLPATGLRVLGGAEGTHGLAATDGTTVVWADRLDRLRISRVSDGQDYAPIDAPAGAGGPLSVSGEIVAWRVEEPGGACPPDCPGHIAAMNFVTRAAVPLVKTRHNELWPRLSGDWLVWVAEDRLPVPTTRAVPGPQGNQVVTSTLLARNLRTMAEPVVLRQTTDPISLPQVEGDRVIWAEQAEAAGGRIRATILTARIGGSQPQVLLQGEDISPYGYDLRGDLLIYSTAAITIDQAAVWAVNLKTGWRKKFEWAATPATDGRYVFWVDQSTWDSRKFRQDMYGYDTATDTKFPLSVNAGVSDFPVAANGVVAWMYHEGTLTFTRSYVYVAVMAEIDHPR